MPRLCPSPGEPCPGSSPGRVRWSKRQPEVYHFVPFQEPLLKLPDALKACRPAWARAENREWGETEEQVFAALGQADLERAMLALPPLVRLTPPSLRLGRPLVLQAADGDIRLGSGWQLAADTTVRTGLGAAQLDLTAARWDAPRVNLHLETWGSIEVLVPEGVAVQVVGGAGSIHLESLSSPVPGGPVLRISTSGPTGAIRIRHPRERNGGWFTRWRRHAA